VFDESIPGFSFFNGNQTVQVPNESFTWNAFIKNLNFFSTEERMTWTSWMTWG